LLNPGVNQDPRRLTSGSNGDLSAGGIRGFQSSFLVDRADNNNGFFSQARGRYRAPYQFSNDVVQEFRVTTNTYGAETGRAGAAVVNVVTKSGSNTYHGKAFYFLRDSSLSAQPAFVGFKPDDRQHQFGATLGGPIVRTGSSFSRDTISTFSACPRWFASPITNVINGFGALADSPSPHARTETSFRGNRELRTAATVVENWR
jgi:hypothetical protein